MHLSITSDATQVILQPQRPSDPKFLLIQVHLHIGHRESPPSHLQSLDLALHRHETLDFDARPEQNVFEPIVVTVDISNQRLTPGTTTSWPLVLEVPQLASPHQSCSGSRSTQYLLATAHYSTRFWKNRVLTARKDVFLIHQPLAPMCYSHVQAGAHDGIGPVLISARSQHLTIGSAIHVQAQLPAPADNFQLRSMDFLVSQHVVLRSRREKGAEQKLAPTQVVLQHVRTSQLPSAQGWLLRIPNCGLLRPSSIGDRAGIHVQHSFSVRFNYQMNHSDLSPLPSCSFSSSSSASSSSSHEHKHRTGQHQTYHSYTLTWNMHLPSCALRAESIMLPTYAEHDASPVPDFARDEIAHDTDRRLCMCGRPFDELAESETESESMLDHFNHRRSSSSSSSSSSSAGSHDEHYDEQRRHSINSLSHSLATKLASDAADLDATPAAATTLQLRAQPVGSTRKRGVATEESYERADPPITPFEEVRW
ncbi:hypothetical protein OC846_005142 [Tilletia horrida]|uniref:Arrestin-like N-terminal domain-containing protein n=1 Tax=Tilletia horrida TaxID=155126 RepID=A0AAN6GNK4_9BASI|nr:hypothetical protein OC846_005142 [Tilletia horrida]